MIINDDILWKIDSEIGKDKKVVELNRIIAKLEEDNTCLRTALKTYEEGRYQEHLENEQLHSIIKEAKECINHYAIEDEDYSKIYNTEEKAILEILDSLEDNESPYCEVCGHCGDIECCGIRDFIEHHIKGKTNCKNEQDIIYELIDLCDYKDEVFKENEKLKKEIEKYKQWERNTYETSQEMLGEQEQ